MAEDDAMDLFAVHQGGIGRRQLCFQLARGCIPDSHAAIAVRSCHEFPVGAVGQCEAFDTGDGGACPQRLRRTLRMIVPVATQMPRAQSPRPQLHPAVRRYGRQLLTGGVKRDLCDGLVAPTEPLSETVGLQGLAQRVFALRRVCGRDGLHCQQQAEFGILVQVADCRRCQLACCGQLGLASWRSLLALRPPVHSSAPIPTGFWRSLPVSLLPARWFAP